MELYCDHEEYQGKLKERWSLAMPRGESKPVADDEIAKLDSMFGDRLKEMASPKAPMSIEEEVASLEGEVDTPF